MRGCFLFVILTACSDPSPGTAWETRGDVKTSTFCYSREVWQDGSWWITFTVQHDADTELDWEHALFSRSEGLVLTRFEVGPDVVQEDGSLHRMWTFWLDSAPAEERVGVHLADAGPLRLRVRESPDEPWRVVKIRGCEVGLRPLAR